MNIKVLVFKVVDFILILEQKRWKGQESLAHLGSSGFTGGMEVEYAESG